MCSRLSRSLLGRDAAVALIVRACLLNGATNIVQGEDSSFSFSIHKYGWRL